MFVEWMNVVDVVYVKKDYYSVYCYYDVVFKYDIVCIDLWY